MSNTNNKVVLADGTVLIDLTSDTVTPETLIMGTTAHSASGAVITGTASTDYEDLQNKPQIGGVTLIGNKTISELGGYVKPDSGIPESDLASDVQTSLGLADTALQSVPNTYRTAIEQDEIDDTKVDKVTGKGLSTNDYTDAEKTTVAAAATHISDTTIHVTASDKSTWSGKQDAISDLEDIRSGAELGSTALQSVPSTYRTAAEQDAIHDSTKQDTISDLADIRSGAALGATALQSVPSTYRTSAAQDTIDSGKLDKATPTDQKEYLYSFAGSEQYTNRALINDMTGTPEQYTDTMVPTAKSVAIAIQDMIKAAEFRVTLFYAGQGTYTANKTFAEISAAYEDNYTVIARFNNIDAELHSATATEIIFLFDYPDLNQRKYITINSDDTITETTYNYVSAISGKGLSTNDYDNTEKASVASAVSHIADSTIHVTASEKSNWNAALTDIDTIEEKIPTQATSSNQLADKSFVNSSIATNTANYISDNGQPFTSVAALEAYTGTVTNNDYAFVTGTDTEGNTYYDRYKASVNGSTVSWAKEYRLNNSSFTAAQWAAIGSGITSVLTSKITTNESNISSLSATVENKVDKVTGKGLSTNDYDATEKANVASAVTHIADTTIHVTSLEKSTWNGKQDAITSSTDLTANSLNAGVLKDKTGEHVLAEYIDSYEEWYLGDGSTPINATDASAFYVPATDASGASDQAATKLYVDDHHDSTKQDTISDLSTIRSGAALGATALQSVPSTYRTSAAQDVIDATKVTATEDGFVTDSNVYYSKDVPDGRHTHGVVDSFGGKSVVWHQFMNDTTTHSLVKGSARTMDLYFPVGVKFVAGHKYYIDFNFSNVVLEETETATGTALGHAIYKRENNKNTLILGSISVQKANFTNGRHGTILTCKYDFTTTAASGNGCAYSYTYISNDFMATTAVDISNIMVIDLTALYGSGNEPTAAVFESQFPSSYYTFDAGSIRPTIVTSIVSKDSSSTTLDTLTIPATVQSLTGYGWSAGSVYNEVDWVNKKFIQRVGSRAYQSGDEDDETVITDGSTTTHYPLTTVVTTDISSLLPVDNYLSVEENGTIEFVQSGSKLAIPSSVRYVNKDVAVVAASVDKKQDALVSGTNIKTINNSSIVGSGNIDVIQGIQINGTDLTKDSDNKVNIPATARSGNVVTLGAVSFSSSSGIAIGNDGAAYINEATSSDITNRNSSVRNPISCRNFDTAVKAAMTDGTGTAWTYSEQVAAQERMGMKYRLIRTITADGTANYVSFDTDSEGNSFQVSEMLIYATIPAVPDYNVGFTFYVRDLESWTWKATGTWTYGILQSSSYASYATIWLQNETGTKWTCKCSTVPNYPGSASGTIYTSFGDTTSAIATQTSITTMLMYINPSSNNIPAGTVFEFWGR